MASSARKIFFVAPAVFGVVAATLSIALVVHTLIDANGWKRRDRLRGELSALQGHNLAAEAELLALGEEVEALTHCRAAQEHAARHELGWVGGANELVIQFDPPR